MESKADEAKIVVADMNGENRVTFEDIFVQCSGRTQSPDLFEENEEEYMPEISGIIANTQSPDLFSDISATPSDIFPENIEFTQTCSPNLFLDDEIENFPNTSTVSPDLFESPQLSNGLAVQGASHVIVMQNEVPITLSNVGGSELEEAHLPDLLNRERELDQAQNDCLSERGLQRSIVLNLLQGDRVDSDDEILIIHQNNEDEEVGTEIQNEENNATAGINEIFLEVVRNRYENNAGPSSAMHSDRRTTPSCNFSRNVDLDQTTFLGQE